MITICVMCAGILVGKFFFSERFKKGNELLQTICTALLIFAMGVTLGQKEDLLDNLLSLGLDSLLFFAIPTAASILIVIFLTRNFPGAGKGKKNVKNREDKAS